MKILPLYKISSPMRISILLPALFCFLIIYFQACNKPGAGARMDEKIIRAYLPSVLDLHKLDFLLYESTVNSRKWIFEGKVENHPAKERLKEMHQNEIPKLKESLHIFKDNWTNEEKQLFDSIWIDFDKMIKTQETIMNELNSFEKYQDPGVYFEVVPLGDMVRKDEISCREKLKKLITIQESKLLEMIK